MQICISLSINNQIGGHANAMKMKVKLRQGWAGRGVGGRRIRAKFHFKPQAGSRRNVFQPNSSLWAPWGWVRRAELEDLPLTSGPLESRLWRDRQAGSPTAESCPWALPLRANVSLFSEMWAEAGSQHLLQELPSPHLWEEQGTCLCNLQCPWILFVQRKWFWLKT